MANRVKTRIKSKTKSKSKSKRLLPVVAAFVALSGAAPAFEPPAIEWEKTFPFNNEFMQVRPARDGGYVLAGDTYEINEKGEALYSTVVIKTDDSGATLWEKDFVWPDVKGILATSDGGILLHSLHCDLIKLDSSGDLVWTKESPRPNPYTIWYRRTIQETDDGGFVAAVEKPFDQGGVLTGISAYLLRMDGEGNVTSEKPIGSKEGVQYSPVDLEKTSDGGLVVAGKCYSEAENVSLLWLLKADREGNVLWETKWSRGNPGLPNGRPLDAADSVRETSDGGYILAGFTLEAHRNCEAERRFLVVEADKEGHVAWARTEKASQSQVGCVPDNFFNALEMAGGGYLVLGSGGRLLGAEASPEVYLVWLDRTGERGWERTLATGFYAPPSQLWLDESTDGGYIVGFPHLVAPGELEFHVVKLAPQSQPAEPFLRGRTDGDGELNLTDAVCVLAYLFGPEGSPCKQSVPACLDAADADDDGKVGITDPICTLLHLFQGGPPLPGLVAECGPDPTPDELGCREFVECE